MSNEVLITARAEIDDVIKALKQIQDKGGDAQKALADTGKAVTDKMRDNTKATQRFLEDLKDFARRAAEEIRGSFESIVKAGALKLGEHLAGQMKGAITGAMTLNDTLRKVGNTLGFTGAEFAKFQTAMTEGLGKLGVDAETAARAMQGLSETQVRGKDAMLDYAKSASLLAGIGGERGKEGEIVKGIAGVIAERGGNVNDRGEMMQVVNGAMGTFLATGKSVSATLDEMRSFFHGLATDKVRAFDPKAFKGMALAEAVSPGALAFFKAYNNQSALGRLPQSAQGLGRAFNEGGLDVDFLRKFLKGAMGRIGFSKEDAMKTFGMDDAAARGAVMLARNFDELEKAQRRAAKQTKTLGEAYEDSLTAGEAVQGGFNRLKAKAAAPLAAGSNAITEMAKKIGHGDFSPVKEHAGLLAGLGLVGLGSLGGGIKGLAGSGKSIASSMMTGAAFQAVSGEKPIPVLVVNMPTGGLLGGGGVGGALGGGTGGSMIGNAAGVVGAMAQASGLGLIIGTGIVEALNRWTTSKSDKTGVDGDWLTRTISEAQQRLSDATGGAIGTNYRAAIEAQQRNTEALNAVRAELERQGKLKPASGAMKPPERTIEGRRGMPQ